MGRRREGARLRVRGECEYGWEEDDGEKTQREGNNLSEGPQKKKLRRIGKAKEPYIRTRRMNRESK